MSLKKRLIQAGSGLALAGALTFFGGQQAQAATWTPNTVADIQNVIEEQAANQDGVIKYQFQWGDTLWGVSQATGIGLDQLTQINNIQNADLIHVGTTIYLSNDNSVVSVEEENEIRSYDVSEEVVVETETPEDVSEQTEAQEVEPSQEVAGEEAVAEEEPVAEAPAEASAASQESSDQAQGQDYAVENVSYNEPAQAEQAPQANPEPAPAPASGGVYSIATSQLGAPYAWAGTSPAGFDCSGFVHWVYAQAGRSIPRSTGGLYSAATPVSNPQVGDLVFFGNGGVSHVGIYAGNGQFIGAQTSTGVAHASVHSGYWGPRFIGYGRI